MSKGNIRVLVVDDSRLIREMICDCLEATPGVEPAGTAGDGQEALKRITEIQPDVVTLDIHMPGMDGLETLDHILRDSPLPVIMVSSLTQRGADTTLEALDRGAMDYVAKPDANRDAEAVLRDELMRKIRAVAGTDVRRILQIRQERKTRHQAAAGRTKIVQAGAGTDDLRLDDKCIAIGISTGGPPALSSIFRALEPPMPPIVIVQHMPEGFTGPFAWRLNSLSQLSVKEAATGNVLTANHVYVAPAGKHLYLRREGSAVKVRIRDGERVSGHKPSVDVMMKCAAELYGDRCLGVVMTGMGRDGADGCKEIRAAGGYVLGQDEATSDVYGMNRVAFVEGGVDEQFGLEDAPATIVRQLRRLWQQPAVGV